MTPVLKFLLEGIILRCILLILAIVFFGCVHHVYVIDEVAFQCPVGAGSWSSSTSSSISSMSSESKSSMLVRSSTVATKWVVGGL